EQSKEENNRIKEQVSNEIYNINIPRSEVKTQNFNVYPDYEYYPKQKLKGFKTTNSLIITTTDFIKVGQIVDAAVKCGATRINNIQFELSEEKQAEVKKEALKKA
ncbi:MAG: SIMPL domain-containing protein, partial [Nanoarchaeota archaeon]